MSMISYAQNFEDVMLNRAFCDVAAGLYIDVGAWHPVSDSVTMHFYSKGWSGINIEPASHAYALLQIHRQRDVNLNVAIADAEEDHILYEVADTGLSTLDKDRGEEYLRAYRNAVRTPVRVTTLKAVCEKYVHREIDFLKIDAEGWEPAVIRGGDWQRFRPRVVLVEAVDSRTQEPVWETWEPVLLDRAYDFVYFDGLNRYYVRREDASLSRHFLVPPNPFDKAIRYAETRFRLERDECQTTLRELRSHDYSDKKLGTSRPFPDSPRLRAALRRTIVLTGLLGILDRIRIEANNPEGTQESVSAGGLAKKGLGALWRVIRRTIPKDARLRTHTLLLALAAFEPVQRPPLAERLSRCARADLGMNIIGHFSAESGLGEAARASARAAQAADIPVALVQYAYGAESRARERSPGVLSSNSKYPINLIQVNAPEMVPESRLWTLQGLSAGYNIAVWFWETTEMPSRWLRAIQCVDEIWAASTFCLDVFSRKSPVPVVRIPVSVEPVRPADVSRAALRIPEKGFLFLCMLDFFSTPERKNPLGSLEAFQRAFGSTKEEVYLVLKVNNSKTRPDAREKVERMVGGDPRIILMDGYMDRPELNALINHCDCLVSLHRSEGFGLPIAEAMYMGKPAIATGWSANMDFMTVDNSLPVRYRLVPVNEPSGPYKGCTGVWAEPDIDHAALQMRRLVSEESLAKTLGQAAAEAIREHFSAKAVGRLMRERLCFIRDLVR